MPYTIFNWHSCSLFNSVWIWCCCGRFSFCFVYFFAKHYHRWITLALMCTLWVFRHQNSTCQFTLSAVFIAIALVSACIHSILRANPLEIDDDKNQCPTIKFVQYSFSQCRVHTAHSAFHICVDDFVVLPLFQFAFFSPLLMFILWLFTADGVCFDKAQLQSIAYVTLVPMRNFDGFLCSVELVVVVFLVRASNLLTFSYLPLIFWTKFDLVWIFISILFNIL